MNTANLTVEIFVLQTPDNALETNKSFSMCGLNAGTEYTFCDDWQKLIGMIRPGVRQLFILPNRIGCNALVNAAIIKRANPEAIVIALTSNPTPGWELSQLDGLISKLGRPATAYGLASAAIKSFSAGLPREDLKIIVNG